MTPSKARANEVKRTSSTNNVVLFSSGHLQLQKARHGTNIYEQWQGLMKNEKIPS